MFDLNCFTEYSDAINSTVHTVAPSDVGVGIADAEVVSSGWDFAGAGAAADVVVVVVGIVCACLWSSERRNGWLEGSTDG